MKKCGNAKGCEKKGEKKRQQVEKVCVTYLGECIIKRNQVLISQGGTGERCRGAANQVCGREVGGKEVRSGQGKNGREKGH